MVTTWSPIVCEQVIRCWKPLPVQGIHFPISWKRDSLLESCPLLSFGITPFMVTLSIQNVIRAIKYVYVMRSSHQVVNLFEKREHREHKTESLAGVKLNLLIHWGKTTRHFFHFVLMNNQFHTERDNRVKTLACKTLPQWISAFNWWTFKLERTNFTNNKKNQ